MPSRNPRDHGLAPEFLPRYECCVNNRTANKTVLVVAPNHENELPDFAYRPCCSSLNQIAARPNGEGTFELNGRSI